MNQLSELDSKIFLWLNSHNSPFFDKVMVLVGSVSVWMPLLIIILVTMTKFFNREMNFISNVALSFTLLLCLVIISYKVFPVLFAPVHRMRPCYDPEIGQMVRMLGAECSDPAFFFAPRSCLAFSLFSYLFFVFKGELKWFKYFMLFWALLVSYSRVYTGVHYPLDVFASSVTGLITGYIVFRIYFYMKNEVFMI